MYDRLSLALAALLHAASHAAPITLRIEGDAQPNGISTTPAVSANGRVVVFTSSATNLVPGQDNGALFAYDTLARTLTALTPGRGNMYVPVVSGDGRYVAMESTDGSLGGGTASGFSDVYRIDRATGAVRQASLGAGGARPNGGSQAPAISGNGRHVAFLSGARNLVAPALAQGRDDVYLADLDSGAVELVTRAANGDPGNKDSLELQGAALSGDGQRLVFETQAENLAPVFAGNISDVLVRIRNPATGALRFENMNRDAAGNVGNGGSTRGAISPNGRYVSFYSYVRNLQPGVNRYALYVRDLDAGTLRAVPDPAGHSECTDSRVDDGANVVMRCTSSDAQRLGQIFTLRHGEATPRLVSVGLNGAPGNKGAGRVFSTDAAGEVVAFSSESTDLVPDDSNIAADVFLRAEPGYFDRLFRDGLE